MIPYLSIIEQNASEYCRIFGKDVVLENHSAVEPIADSTDEEVQLLDLISENWNAPVVVTTSVQFLESLFAASPSRCRKLHRIARSVVVFDEVQTLPAHLLQPTFSVFRELERNYGVSFVFSSATQPAFRRCPALPDGFGPDELHPIIPESEEREMYTRLRRVRYHLPKEGQTIDWPELAERLMSLPQVLCVVNVRGDAAKLWEQLARLLPAEERPIHLSSTLCAQHRLDLLKNIRASLKAGCSCRVISTQLVEAGVDLDFPIVWRALGPLDSIVQVAGRCNREGVRINQEGSPLYGDVHIFRPVEHKLPPGVYRAGAHQAAITLASLGDKETAAERLATDSTLFGDYFQQLWQVVNTDYAKPREPSIQEDRKELRFREVAKKAKVIPNDTKPIVVPYGDGASIVDEIRARTVNSSQSRFTRDDLRRLQRFMVNVRTCKFEDLRRYFQLEELLPNAVKRG